MKLSRKFSVRAAILTIAAIAAVLAVFRWNDAGPRFRRTGDEAAFYVRLKDRIRNGDPIDQVSRVLGPGHRETDPRHHADSVNYARRNKSENPQGGQDADEFYSWKTSGWIHTLQFRDGCLINHNPAIYPLKPLTLLSD